MQLCCKSKHCFENGPLPVKKEKFCGRNPLFAVAIGFVITRVDFEPHAGTVHALLFHPAEKRHAPRSCPGNGRSGRHRFCPHKRRSGRMNFHADGHLQSRTGNGQRARLSHGVLCPGTKPGHYQTNDPREVFHTSERYGFPADRKRKKAGRIIPPTFYKRKEIIVPERKERYTRNGNPHPVTENRLREQTGRV